MERSEDMKNKKILYAKIAQGQIDSLSLQLIKKEADDLSQGKREFERYEGDNGYISRTEPRLSEGMRRAGEIHAAAALICRADESSGREDTPGSDGGRRTPLAEWNERQRTAGRRQELLLQKYAEATDCWYQVDNLDESLIIGSGGESVVYRYDETNVLKVNTLRYTVSPQILLDRITLHNYMFPDTAMKVLGFARNEFGEFCILYTQPFVEGVKPTRRQIEKHLHEIGRGVDRYLLDGTNYKNDFVLFDDFHLENVILDRQGRLRVIDSDLKFNTPDLGLGGRFKIPPAGNDIGLHNSEKKEKMNRNSISNHVELTGILHSCETRPIFSQIPGTVMAKMEICTATVRTVNGRPEYADPMFHRVVTTASGKMAEKLQLMEKECARCREENARNPEAPLKYASAASVSGHLRVDNRNEAYVFAEELSFPESLTMKNSMELSGKITKTTLNGSYASVEISTKDPVAEKDIRIPITVFKNQHAAYNQFHTGNLENGQNVNVSGTLMSLYFNNGKDSIWRCSMNVRNVTKLKKEKTQKTGQTL